jgi:hypothetical protein
MRKMHSASAKVRRGPAIARSGRQRRCLAALLLWVVGHSALAGTAGVANGEFDADLSGWTLAGPPLPGWSMFDYLDNPASGSVELTNDAAQASARFYPLRQCVYLPAAGSYRVQAQGYLPVGHPGGRLVISLSGHVASDCSGGSNPALGYFVSSNGNWQYGSADFTIIPGVNHLEILLGIEKDEAGGSLVGNLDGIRLIYRELIFANSFEVGNLPSPEP